MSALLAQVHDNPLTWACYPVGGRPTKALSAIGNVGSRAGKAKHHQRGAAQQVRNAEDSDQ
jgi:hypothetical protein